jgi:putative protease
MIYSDSSYIRSHTYTGLVQNYDEKTFLAKVYEINPLFINDEIILMSPHFKNYRQTVSMLYDKDMNPIDKANHPGMEYYIKTDIPVEKDTIIIKEVSNE